MTQPLDFDLNLLLTPYYLVDKRRIRENLQCLQAVATASGAKVLLAQKAFSMFALYPLIKTHLDGACASGLFEAKLSAEYLGKQTHIFSPAYKEETFGDILALCDHVIFNSLSQWDRFAKPTLQTKRSAGLRINPEHSTQSCAIYDPCRADSRLGIRRDMLGDKLPEGIEGLHFHTLCEQNANALVTTWEAVEQKFHSFLPELAWLNLGGGHHITRPDYDQKTLIELIIFIRAQYDVTVYLEPGEAVALHAGYLVSEVVDIFEAGGEQHVIMDASAACHMPDVLEMPYRPNLIGAALPDKKPWTYYLGGPTCLAGDTIGRYSFDQPLFVGQRLAFEDMAHYTMVKTNTFNGIGLPSIAIIDDDRSIRLQKAFGYEDVKNRLS